MDSQLASSWFFDTACSENRRSIRVLTATVAVAAFLVVAAPPPLFGQTYSDADASAQSRPLVLSPSLRLTDFGWNDNVFRLSKIDRPIGDFMATVNPGLHALWRLQRLKVDGHGDIDFVYFRQISQFRSVDTDDGSRVELLLGPLTPYVEGAWANTRHRQSYEIDLPIRRVDSSWAAGVDVRLSGKTSIGLMTRRLHVDYKGETVYLDTDLARYLGQTAAIDGVKLRYSVTPITTVGADVERERNDLPLAPERNADGFRVMSVIEFKPLALVSGSAQVGVRKRTFRDSKAPPFQGAVARINVGCTLLGQTRFDVSGERDLSYSYRADQRDYLQTGVALTITQRLGNAWDVDATLGRYSLNYGFGEVSRASLAERVAIYGLGAGYHFERTRVGFQVGRQTRTSDFSTNRGYAEMQITSSVSYGF